MPCSICGKRGHNRTTCPNKEIQQEPEQPEQPEEPEEPELAREELGIEDPLILLTLYEIEIRNCLINNSIDLKTKEEIEFISSLLNVEKKEFQMINYHDINPVSLHISNGNKNMIGFNNNEIDYSFIGFIDPKTIHKLVTFSGYTYMIKHLDDIIFIEVNKSMKDNCVIDFNPKLTFGLNNNNESFISLLKMNYLIQQMIRLGGLEDDNFGSILDLYQDIEIPKFTNLDLEVAGLPNELTNIT